MTQDGASKAAVGSALLALAACAGGNPSPPPLNPATIDPMAYLAERQTPGDLGSPQMTTATAMNYRRQDFGHYQDEDSFLLSDGSAATAWSYAPFGPFVAANGDGGEHYVLTNGEVDIVATQDGSKPGIQTFVGWVVFRNDATTTPACFVAPIGAWTCYYRATVSYPNLGAIDTIVSEHYDLSSPVTAQAMERSFFGYGWGRLTWQAWTRGGAPVDPARCPDFGFNAPPAAGWTLSDCRESVNLVDQFTPMTPLQLWQPYNETATEN